VENNLHWSLAIAFREDESPIRQRQAAENFTALRHIALCFWIIWRISASSFLRVLCF
jgi:predicted transposase YbfD/YdcC